MPETEPPRESSGVTLGDVFGGIHNSIIAGRDVVLNFFAGGTSAQRERRDREAMLHLVRSFWIEGYLEPSLHGAARIELGLMEKAGALAHPWKTVVEVKDQPTRLLPSGTPILDVFDEVGQSLLILGEPGGGKTTTLLELARDAIARAGEDESQPIPVVFNLSSWKEGKSLDAWIVEELDGKYYVPKKIGRRWLENDELLLLLDGLDEVGEQDRQACVEAINAFRAESPMPFAVCCRSREYEELSTRLRVKGEVVLQDLTPEQVDGYLEDAGDKLAGVREALRNDPNLEELTRSPLMLSVMTLAYGDLSAAKLQRTAVPENRRRHLFDTYIRRMFERRPSGDYSPKQTVLWLSWLARAMKRQGETVLVVERMQPAYLEGKGPRWGYSLISRILGALCFLGLTTVATTMGATLPGLLRLGIGFGAIEGMRQSLGGPGARAGLRLGYLLAVILWGILSTSLTFLADSQEISKIVLAGLGEGVALGLFFGRVRPGGEDIRLAERLGWSWRGVLVGLFLGSAVILPLLVGTQDDLSSETIIAGLFIGGGIGGLIGGLRPWQVESEAAPGMGLASCARIAVYASLACGVLYGVALGLALLPGVFLAPPIYAITEGLDMAVNVIPAVTALAFLLCGGFDLLKHFTLRLALAAGGHAPWRYFHFLDHASSLVFLRRVGSGYVFIHRLLFEHFAALNDGGELSLTPSKRRAEARIRSRRLKEAVAGLHWQWITAGLLLCVWAGIGAASRMEVVSRARVEALCNQAAEQANAFQWDKAIGLYDQALKLDPSLPRAHEERGETYFYQGLAFGNSGRKDLAREAFAHAAADLTRALDLGFLPQADAYYARSLAHLVAGDFDRAVQDASKATELDSDDPEGWSTRSYALYQRGLDREKANRLEDARSDYQEAITSATRALERKHSLPGTVLTNRALAYEGIGEMDHAMADLHQAAKAEPGSAITLSELCKRGSLWGRAIEVLPWCDQAVAVEPDNPRWRDRRGIARALAGDLQGAADDFAAYLRWAETGDPVPEVLASRRAWLAALRAGRNPFDAKTLKRLRYE